MVRKKTGKKIQPSLSVQKIDEYALRLQKDKNDIEAFEAIHFSLHKFMMGQSFHKFIIKGQEGKDLYQESLIVLWQKAIPSFDPTRGMSFLGFAKMCISRHLITLLNTSVNRKKDMPINLSISLDEIFNDEDDKDGSCSLQNLFNDGTDFLQDLCTKELKDKTIQSLQKSLSSFESVVFSNYLDGLSYKEISTLLTCLFGRDCNEKSIDNALLRIRRKAVELLRDNISAPYFDKE